MSLEQEQDDLTKFLLNCARVIAVGFVCVALLAWLATRPERYQPPPQVGCGPADTNRTIAIWEPGADGRWYYGGWINLRLVCHPRPPVPPPPELMQGVQQVLGELDQKAKPAR
jgi:hypothetical protein